MSELNNFENPMAVKEQTGEIVTNKELMAKARASLNGKWGIAVSIFIIFVFVSLGVGLIPMGGSVVQILIEGALCLGLYGFVLNLIREKDISISQLFDGFKKFGVALGTFLLVSIFTFLWSLLLIIPGIIAALSYAMVFFILFDDSDIGVLEAIRKSKAMMKGNKWKLFCLSWRFFWWGLLCVLTFGIGFIWLNPYMLTSKAHFYENIK